MARMSPHARKLYADANGKTPPERLRDYFDFEQFPEKASMKVTRIELLAWLMRQEQVRREHSWPRRLWKFLRRPVGSKPAVLAATEGEKERGEVQESEL